ncbi:hypothetical protein Q9R32_07890 [Actinotalea sp. AC32]|nr:hypothetical protein [Actinotalea sp. AC32]
MNDDPFVRRLRTLADPAPPVLVDGDRVLRLGRRRRALRAAGVGVATVVAAAGAFTAAALPATTDGRVTSATATRGGPVTTATTSPAPAAVVDEEAGTITLPLDEWFWDSADIATMETAVDLYVSRCMADAGLGAEYTFHGAFPVQPDRLEYGVWSRDVVLESGYRSLVPDDSRPGGGLRGDDPRVSTQVGCYRSAMAEGLTYEPGDFEALAPVGYTSPTYLPEGQEVLADWRRCLADNDVAAPDDDTSTVPRGVLDAPLDEQIRVGLIDVACKEQTDYVRRMADVHAAEQAAYIERARGYLEQIRPVQESVVARSRAYLEDAGVAVPGE